MKSLRLTNKTFLFFPCAAHLSWKGWQSAQLRITSCGRRCICWRSRTCKFSLLDMAGDVVGKALPLLGIVVCYWL